MPRLSWNLSLLLKLTIITSLNSKILNSGAQQLKLGNLTPTAGDRYQIMRQDHQLGIDAFVAEAIRLSPNVTPTQTLMLLQSCIKIMPKSGGSNRPVGRPGWFLFSASDRCRVSAARRASWAEPRPSRTPPAATRGTTSIRPRRSSLACRCPPQRRRRSRPRVQFWSTPMGRGSCNFQFIPIISFMAKTNHFFSWFHENT